MVWNRYKTVCSIHGVYRFAYRVYVHGSLKTVKVENGNKEIVKETKPEQRADNRPMGPQYSDEIPHQKRGHQLDSKKNVY